MKKEFRKLSDDEKKITKKVLESREEELSHLKLMVKYNDFMLDDMLYSNYLEKRRGFVRQTKDFEIEIDELERNITISKEQLTKGVEVVENAPTMVE